ncbi:MAG: amidase [Leptolyngbyaceae cyanobacterium MO_188.B28]|nr:amidase [Leptolyngbyaceae cyanobacterium MO_188.B28]
MIRDRRVSSVKVIEAYLAQIDRHNPQLNAVCTLDRAEAGQRAQADDEALSRGENWGVLHGVPITIKDEFETAGLLTTAGYRPLKEYRPKEDATVVARLRAAGDVILGKTTPAKLGGDYQVAQPIKSALQTAAQTLADKGAQVEKWTPRFDFVSAWRVYYLALGVYVSLLSSQSFSFDYVRDSLTLMYREASQGDRALRKLNNVPGVSISQSLNPNPRGYFEALTERDRLIAQMDAELEPWDVWLCPVAMTVAFTHRERGEAVDVDGVRAPYLLASGAYTIPFNFTGHPVVVILIGQTSEGLPIGMQVASNWTLD